MAAEAAPLIAHLGLAKVTGTLAGPLTCDVYSGTAHGVSVHVVTNGAARGGAAAVRGRRRG
jgi:hypothetical protein